MKLSYIIVIIVIAASLGIIITTMGNTSQYVDFQQAIEIAQGGSTQKVHVVGLVKKDSKGKILEMNYNPVKNPNYLTFQMIDDKNKELTVVYHNPPPPDLKKSEKIVVVGKYENNQFVASSIILKCPSKYKEDEIKM
jgi:cytochrome c-type biogenesis protein CcmE